MSLTPAIDQAESAQAEVAPGMILDSRLALYHREHRWLTVADLHFGYELSQRVAGNLFPLWGMKTIETRLLELLSDYAPSHLVLLGDLVHNRAGAADLSHLIEKLSARCETILIAGNHDRYLRNFATTLPEGIGRVSAGAGPCFQLRDRWECGPFQFHHGHCETPDASLIQIVGHHHPAFTIRDGAGLRLKLPALVQTSTCWVMPAFSPWAGGVEWTGDEQAVNWLCSPRRILKIIREAG